MFFPTLIIGALIIIAAHNLFADGMLLGWLGRIFDRRLPEPMQKPIYTCRACMASVYGSAVWFWAQGDIYTWPVFVIALSGLMVILSEIIPPND